jgi:hypothetical protein
MISFIMQLQCNAISHYIINYSSFFIYVFSELFQYDYTFPDYLNFVNPFISTSKLIMFINLRRSGYQQTEWSIANDSRSQLYSFFFHFLKLKSDKVFEHDLIIGEWNYPRFVAQDFEFRVSTISPLTSMKYWMGLSRYIYYYYCRLPKYFLYRNWIYMDNILVMLHLSNFVKSNHK